MQAKALALSADQVLLDLEDAVAPSEKAAARLLVVEALRAHDYRGAGGKVVSVRVNAVDTPWCYRDVIEVVEAAGDHLDTLVLPKANNPADVQFLDRLLTQIEQAREWEIGRIGLEPQIESSSGLLQVDAIAAASPRNQALIFGPGDLSASLGLQQLTIGKVEGDRRVAFFDYVFARILVAARAHGLLAIDGPYGVVADLEGLEGTARATADLGFDGKWAIHPDQIETINRLYTPDREAYERARALLDAYRTATEGEGRGAVRFGNEMIDEANRKMAEQVVTRGAPIYGAR